jgi:hypothetical protein
LLRQSLSSRIILSSPKKSKGQHLPEKRRKHLWEEKNQSLLPSGLIRKKHGLRIMDIEAGKQPGSTERGKYPYEEDYL